MSESDTPGSGPAGPLLLCYDGSANAAVAIGRSAALFSRRRAVVLTAWEPMALWDPRDPATILSAPLDKLAARALDLDQIIEEVSGETLEHGVELAREAGFAAEGRLVRGKAWSVICHVAQELDAGAIVIGARGLSRVQSMLLGSVSFAVLGHARRPVLVIPHGDPKA
ncbi:MAG TPA: universal stress protein [Solirubrobacteraceae bacterium]|nr:universal stress protein [Solirubrobacteraceae bacterium]